MKDIISFNFNKQTVRVAILNNEEWFCVSDVGFILGLKNAQRHARNLPIKGRKVIPTPTEGGTQKLQYVNEANLYRLIFRSSKESAIKFQDWIFEEVIPTIRKTGKYSIPEKIKKKSKEDRNFITSAWDECGVSKPYEFIQLTLQEYKALKFEDGKRKKDFSKHEILLLSALESMEALKLFSDHKDGYYECKDSLHNTARIVNDIDKKELK